MVRSLPIQVGVTGGIGAGKSVVCQIFECLSVPVYAADQRANWLSDHDPAIRQEVLAMLGPDSYTSGGTYNRKYVASRVFSEPVLLQQLNQIIHPKVFADSERWLQKQAHQPYVIREAALMNKAGDKNSLDYVIVVDAPLDLRVERTKLRDPHRSEAEIRAIIARQIADEERLKLADFVVENDQENALIPQILKLHRYFLEKGKEAKERNEV